MPEIAEAWTEVYWLMGDCGPLPFMMKIRNEAIDAGIPATNIHYEVFGPDIWLAN
ncbi:hypothetical protein [Arthrobacter sp. ISL-28]|uniref:hypothetical protein n=1 Tax=Arthrobacter sp. ISL-28 TaxID=2819108 RepID=UPI001BEB54A8|nr:hypothetical protein [Arthrobacter sp. ISL-28]MBT2520757.1 hypothetical protein [Arthrobacter sp. ISL-28]